MFSLLKKSSWLARVSYRATDLARLFHDGGDPYRMSAFFISKSCTLVIPPAQKRLPPTSVVEGVRIRVGFWGQ
jgi:hypothetical protein